MAKTEVSLSFPKASRLEQLLSLGKPSSPYAGCHPCCVPGTVVSAYDICALGGEHRRPQGHMGGHQTWSGSHDMICGRGESQTKT